MASIKQRGSKFNVIYYGIKTNGSYGQIWEAFDDEGAAEIRKAEIELEKKKAAFNGNNGGIPVKEKKPISTATQVASSPTPNPNISNTTFSDLAKRWFEIYPINNWGFSMYDMAEYLYRSHIEPYLGQKNIHEITPMDIEAYMAQLKMTKVKRGKNQTKKDEDSPYLSSSTRRSIYLLVKQIFDKAVEWGSLSESPVKIKAPKKTCKSRDIWDVTTMQNALDDISDPLLHLGVHMSFVCTLRIGECCALSWDDIDFAKGRIDISKTMRRVSKTALAKLPKGDIFHIFSEKKKDSKSLLVIKKPKTLGSERSLYMTEPLKNELLERKAQYEKTKLYLGSDFIDNNLVFSLDNGTPIEPHLLQKWFNKWQSSTSITIPITIDFHSIRHSSTTYKLQISGGDIKAVQGDTGHNSADMIVNTYAHMQDSNRQFMMRTLEDSFYGQSPSADTLSNLNKMILSLEPDQKMQLLALISGNADNAHVLNY